ncbi:MAG: tyrosine/phenylalanine carboxypeptidase domain-containing protein [Bacteriovoracaceae bacterium]
MPNQEIIEFSAKLKDIAKDLSFLGHPRYPLKTLIKLFPEHHTFIAELEDEAIPFQINIADKKRKMDDFLKQLSHSGLSPEIKAVFTKRIEDYHLLTSMMENFGKDQFYENCKSLYGSSLTHSQNDAFFYFLEKMTDYCRPDINTEKLHGKDALKYLKDKMLETFPENEFEVKASTSLLSDSSAGRKTLKLNPHKSYTQGQLNIFLVHEGWVHLGTSLNGAIQTEHPWLGTWAPRTTFLQEGLAILTELVTGHMTLERWNKILLRHIATTMAEKGSPITDIYSYLRHHQLEELDAFKLSLRVFRGVPLSGGAAFTKELLYLHGLIELLSHLNQHQNNLQGLWSGKMSFEEHAIIVNDPKICLKYFPKALEEQDCQNRLSRLKQLSLSLQNDF